MRKIQPLALVVCATFLVSCATGCNQSFDWEPRPYVGDSASQSLINGDGEVIRCDQVVFDSFTCFDPVNIAELRTAIGQVTNKKEKQRLEEAMKSLDTQVWYSKSSRTKLLDQDQLDDSAE